MNLNQIFELRVTTKPPKVTSVRRTSTVTGVLDKTSRPIALLDRGIKLRTVVDSLPLNVWRTYYESG